MFEDYNSTVIRLFVKMYCYTEWCNYFNKWLQPISCFLLLLFLSVNGQKLSGQSLNDTIELQEVQVHAARIFQKETAGMKQTRIDTLAITGKLQLSLSELLSENSPVYIKSHGRGALATASFRGTASSHTQVNWNGININSPMLGMVDFSTIPVYIIDDITLKHGGASVADRSGGLGGSINIANRPDFANPTQLSYLAGVGSFSTWDQFLMTSHGNSKLQWRSRLYYTGSENNYTFLNRTIAEPGRGQWVHPMDTNKYASYNRYGTLQEIYWQPAPQQVVTAQWWGQWSQRGIPRVISFEGPDNTNISRQKEQDHKAILRWQWYGENQDLSIRSGYSFKQLDYTLSNQVSGLGSVAAVYSESDQHSFMQHATYRREFSSAFSFEGAINFDHHRVNTLDSVTQTGYANRRNDLSLLAAFRSRLHKRLNINFLLRQDVLQSEVAPLIPFLGVDYLLWEENALVIKGNLTRNYRHPSLNDLYWVPGGNPDLKPERGFSQEIGLQHIRTIGGMEIHPEITFFRSDINDWIIWIPSFKGYWEPQNIRRVLSRGLEVIGSVSGQVGDIRYRVLGNYTFTQATNYGDQAQWGDESYGKQLVFIPKHAGNVLVNVQYKGFALSWQHNSFSERFTTSSNDISRRNWLYPYYMNDLALEKYWRFERWGLQTQFKVYNLFDETYHTILYRPMPGRNFMLSLRVDWFR